MANEAFSFSPGAKKSFDNEKIFFSALHSVIKESDKLTKLRYENYCRCVHLLDKVVSSAFLKDKSALQIYLQSRVCPKLISQPSASPHRAPLFLCLLDDHFQLDVDVLEMAKEYLQVANIFKADPRLYDSIGDVRNQIRDVLTSDNGERCELPLELALSSLDAANASDRLLILVEDGDQFPSMLLNEIFKLSICLKDRLSLALVIFWRKSMEDFHNQTTVDLPCHFDTCASRLQSQGATVVQNVLNQLNDSKNSMFRLDSGVQSYIVAHCSSRRYLCLEELRRLYKLCLLEHFRRNPWAFCTSTIDNLEKTVDALSALPEANSLLGHKAPGAKKMSKVQVSSAFRKHEEDEEGRRFALKLLWILNKNLPHRPFGRTKRMFQSNIERVDYIASQRWLDDFCSMSSVEESSLEATIDRCFEIVENNGPKNNPLFQALLDWKNRSQADLAPRRTVDKLVPQSTGRKVTLQSLQADLQLTRKRKRDIRFLTEKKYFNSIATAFSNMLKPSSAQHFWTATRFADTCWLRRCCQPTIWQNLQEQIASSPSGDAAVVMSIFLSVNAESYSMAWLFANFLQHLKSFKSVTKEHLYARLLKVVANLEYVGVVSVFKRGGALHLKSLLWA